MLPVHPLRKQLVCLLHAHTTHHVKYPQESDFRTTAVRTPCGKDLHPTPLSAKLRVGLRKMFAIVLKTFICTVCTRTASHIVCLCVCAQFCARISGAKQWAGTQHPTSQQRCPRVVGQGSVLQLLFGTSAAIELTQQHRLLFSKTQTKWTGAVLWTFVVDSFQCLDFIFLLIFF